MEIDVLKLKDMRDGGESVTLLDVRERLGTDAVMADVVQQFNARMAKAGVAI